MQSIFAPGFSSFFKSRGRAIVLYGLSVCVIYFVFYTRIDRTQFHGDETNWITTSLYSSQLLIDLDFSRRSWMAPHMQADVARLNPHLGKFMLGLPLLAVLPEELKSFSCFYRWRSTVEENKKRGLIPSEPLLRTARQVMICYSVACCVLLFLIGTLLINRVAGAACVVLFILNRSLMMSFARAMMDSPYNLFLLCTLLTTLHLVGQKSESNAYSAALTIIAGVCAGCATSVKIIAFPVTALFFAIALAVFYRTVRNVGRIAGLYARFLVAQLSVFYLLYPLAWPRFTPDSLMPSLSPLLEFPTLFIKFNQVFKLVAQWSNPAWADWIVRLRELHYSMYHYSIGVPFQELLFAIGLFKLIREGVREKNSAAAYRYLTMAGYVAVYYAILLCFNPLNFDRYYYPLAIGVVIVTGVGVASVAASISVGARKHAVRAMNYFSHR